MKQQAVTVREIQAAGGLGPWMRKVGQQARESVQGRQVLAGKIPVARGRKPADTTLGYAAERMNKLEARYAMRLEELRRAGKIVFWKFEAVALRLANRTTYNPDFYLMLADGSLGFHETKGFWRDDARAKIKIAAEQFPEWFFVAVQWNSKARDWKFEHFGNAER